MSITIKSLFLLLSIFFFPAPAKCEFSTLKKLLDKHFKAKQYEELQVIVDDFFHKNRDEPYTLEKSWFGSKETLEIAIKIDRHKFILNWLRNKYKNKLCSWAYYNVFRDAMRSFSYQVKTLESYSKHTLANTFGWMIFFNFLHIGLVKYYKNKKLDKKWYSKRSPAAFFKDCCYHRIKKYVPKKQMPDFGSCWKKAQYLLLQSQIDYLHDCGQLLFVYNDSWGSNWLSQKNPTKKLLSSIGGYSAREIINKVLNKARGHFSTSFFSSGWDDFWKLKEADIKLNGW